MKLSLHIAQKLLELSQGQKLPFSGLRHNEIISRMEADGILIRHGRGRAVYSMRDREAFSEYLKNHLGIPDLEKYLEFLRAETTTRAESINVASDSKIKRVRTFKGFPVNCYTFIEATLYGKPITIEPRPGSFTFIHDFETFIPAPHITVVGVENPENFRFVERQQYLFSGIETLFVNRYPQSGDLVKWLQGISNHYLHYGDFDFAGIAIFLNEYKNNLGQRARFFVPDNIDSLIQKFGKRSLYNSQLHQAPNITTLDDLIIAGLVSKLHLYKKGLEQEIMIRSDIA